MKNFSNLVTGCWINGKEVKKSKTMPVENPADGSVVAHVSMGNQEDIEASVKAAKKAFYKWREEGVEKRADIIKKWAEVLKGSKEFLATLLSFEVGKPISSAKSEVQSAISFLEYCASEAVRFKHTFHGSLITPGSFFIVREPIGVCGVITPYNYPLSTFVTKVGPALSMGCTVITKPDEHTPLTTLFVARLASKSGLPEGVLNVVCGPGEDVGRRLVEHPDVRLISFTGSTDVGKEILTKSASNLKRVILELGGNCPAIIAGDAKWRDYMERIVNQTFKNSGQYCYRITRLIVHESIFDEFLEAFAERTSQLKVGHPLDNSSDLGPLNNRRIYERFRQQIISMKEAGAEIFLGEIPEEVSKTSGYYCHPIIFTEVPDGSAFWQEEYFGPVAFFQKYSADDEAIKIANSTRFGLAAYIFTSDIKRAYKWSNLIEAGSVWINCIHQARFDAPFGGYKESGLGREKSHHGFEAFTELKTIYTQF